MGSEVSVGRQTPYELVFDTEDLAEREFPAIAEEARRRGAPTARREIFATLPRVGSVLAELVPEEVEPAAIDHYLDILFHCYCFWDAGRPFYAADAAVVRSLIESPPDLGAAPLRAAHSSCYLELPRNLFWADVTETGLPEPVEGMFIRLNPDDLSQEADLLLILGMRHERQGFSAAALRARLEETRDVAEVQAFRSTIPGADLAALYSLQRASEVVSLAARLLWYIESYPEALSGQPGTVESQGSGRPTPTRLDHLKVVLVERERG